MWPSQGHPPSFPTRRQESILPPRPPPVGATLVVARSRRPPVSIPLCGLRKATFRPACPDTGQESILPPRPPPVGATLVVARSRRQPVFIPLCGLRQGHPSFLRRACVPRHGAGIHPLPPPRPIRHSRAPPVIPAEAGIHPLRHPAPAEAGIHPLRALCGESSPPPRMQQNATRRDKGTPFSPPPPTSQRGSIVANPQT